MVIDDGGPDFGLISNPQQLIRAHLGAVGGFGGSGCGEQLLQTDGDYHRCRYSADGGLILSFEEPGAGFFERIVQPLHLGTFIGDLDDVAVFVFDGAAAGCGEWVQDRVQLGTDGVGEPAVQMPPAVPALFQLHIAPVVLQLVIDGFRAVGVGSIHHRLGEPLQLSGRQEGCLFR